MHDADRGCPSEVRIRADGVAMIMAAVVVVRCAGDDRQAGAGS
jgi:hypothetical protein